LDAIIDALIVTGVSLTVNVIFFLWFLSYLEKRMDRMLEKDDEPSFRDMAKDPHLRRLVVEDMNPKIYEKIGIAACIHCDGFYESEYGDTCPHCMNTSS